jgi:hypothetical protein
MWYSLLLSLRPYACFISIATQPTSVMVRIEGLHFMFSRDVYFDQILAFRGSKIKRKRVFKNFIVHSAWKWKFICIKLKRFKVLSAIHFWIMVFSIMIPCSVLVGYQSFGRTYSLHFQGRNERHFLLTVTLFMCAVSQYCYNLKKYK